MASCHGPLQAQSRSTPGPLSHLHRNTYLYKYPQLILVLLAPAPPTVATFMLYRTWIVVQQAAQQNSIKSTVTRMYMMRIAQCIQLLAAFGEAKTI